MVLSQHIRRGPISATLVVCMILLLSSSFTKHDLLQGLNNVSMNNVSTLHHQTLNVSGLNEWLLKHLVKKYLGAQGLDLHNPLSTTLKKREEVCNVQRLRGEESELCKDFASRELISRLSDQNKPIPYLRRDFNCEQRQKDYAKGGGPSLTFAASHTSFPPYLELQYHLLRRFVRDDFRMIAYDDAWEGAVAPGGKQTITSKSSEIREMCQNLGIEYRKVPQDLHIRREFLFPNTWESDLHNFNTRAADVFQFMLKDNLCESRYLVLMDSDIFLLKPFSIPQHMANFKFDFGGPIQGREHGVKYTWNVLNIFDLHKMPSLDMFSYDCGVVCITPTECSRVDVGGQQHYYFLQRTRSEGDRQLILDHVPPDGKAIETSGVRFLMQAVITRDLQQLNNLLAIDDVKISEEEYHSLPETKRRVKDSVHYRSGQGDVVHFGSENPIYPAECFSCSAVQGSGRICRGYCTDGNVCHLEHVPGAVDCRTHMNAAALEDILDSTQAWAMHWDVFENAFLHIHNGAQWVAEDGRSIESTTQFVEAMKNLFFLRPETHGAVNGVWEAK